MEEKEMARRVAPSGDFAAPFCAMNVEVIKAYEDEVSSVLSDLEDVLEDIY